MCTGCAIVPVIMLLFEVYSSISESCHQISHTLPTTRHCCNLDVWALAQSRGNAHCSLVTPEMVLSEYNKDLIFLT